jgi:hypothetical protein
LAHGLVSCALGWLLAAAAPAQTIDISLNVHYTTPGDIDSGGTWEVVAKSTNFGIANLSLRLANIDAAAQFLAPRGTVNGSDGAGFSILANSPQGEHRNITLGQAPLPLNAMEPGDNQTIFYGVGTITNGMPGDVGPTYSSLTNVQNVPWAPDPPGDVFGDPVWDIAATFVSGTFAEGVTPSILATTTGQVLTQLGTATSFPYGSIEQASVNLFVRTGSPGGGALPDYNQNGVVDAADYVLWRKGAFPQADGNNNGMIDEGDYDVWREFFGATVPPGSGAGAGANLAVPEPGAAALVAVAAVALALARRRARS